MVALVTTGTYNFSPPGGVLSLLAFSRIGKRGADIGTDMLQVCETEMNLMQQEWNNRGPNLWTVDELSYPMLNGIKTYPIDAATVMITSATISYGDPPNQTDLVITALSKDEYFAYPNKDTPGRPTSFWFDRTVTPTVTLWPVPDQTYTLKIKRFRRIQDAQLAGGYNMELDPLWLDAAVAGMAHRLARHYATPLEASRKQDAADAYKIAADQNVESVNTYMVAGIGGYFR